MGTPRTIEQILRRAGLDAERLAPKLKLAGFDTIEALSELKTEYFPALDVTEPSERRKLFMLVQTLVNCRPKRSSTEPSTEAKQETTATNRDAFTRQRSNSSDSFDSKIPVPSPSRGSKRPNNANATSSVLPPPPGENEAASWKTEPTAETRNYSGSDEEESDEFEDAEQGEEDLFEPSPPRRSRRLQKGHTATNTSSDVTKPPSTTTSYLSSAPLHSTTVTNRRFSSRLSTPIKRSKEPARANTKIQPLNSRLLPPTEPDREVSFGHDVETAPSQESTESLMNYITPVSSHELADSTIVVSEGFNKDSFQGQIEALRMQNTEEHKMFHEPEIEVPQSAGRMRIRVVVRKRPMSTSEIALTGNVDILHPLDCQSFGKMLVYQPKTRVDLKKEIETIPFAFDNVFDERSNNAEIYERAVQPLIPGFFEKQWATLFAYGQTGSGKTYTTLGSVHTTGARDCCYGLYFLAAMDVFQYLRSHPALGLTVRVSLFEIYGGNLYDLFNDRKLVKCLEDAKGKINFIGLSERDLSSPHDLMHWIHEGSALRSTGTTSRNADSSRSHAVLQLHLYKESDNSEYSRMTFIDLAGSERGADTNTACRTTRQEGADINTSLLSLKEVIRALAKGKEEGSHVPFRGSKLTQVLKESFIGKNCRSVMIACVSPNIGNCEQTLNTLRYANRVKERNPETGACNNDAVVEVRPTVRRPQIDQDDTENRVLDELLASNRSLRPQTSIASSDKAPTETFAASMGNPLMLGEVVIRTHKSMMQEMMDMVRDEMNLLTNSEIETDEYLRSCDILHLRQLQLVQELRARIQAYRQSRSVTESTTSVDVFEDDDSIIDLRE